MADVLGYVGKRVIVTGCFSGMGEATARLLLDLGAEVHGFDYKDTSLKLTSFTNVDLRDPASIDASVAKLGGKVDALFNCAGLPHTFPALEVMKVNFLGTRHLTEQVLPLMSEGGAVVSIASNGGLGWSRNIPANMELIATPGFAGGLDWCERNADKVGGGYAFSKENIIVWTQFTAAQTIKRGIRLNCTLPGPTQTPMMKDFHEASGKDMVDSMMGPIGRYSTPEEQAAPLVLLNSDLAKMINGVVLPVDGGFMGALATGQVDLSRMMAKKG
ncbi:coniferyl-alcohol dehydrogenase [Sphingomonas tabacisoli]|uniref:Coniferyl-alcohol dehydrogenase n=1 Tax=Sphingomonas tabacisoli TaxID=2249466 RepID=A0ABW4I5I5_9SPHN